MISKPVLWAISSFFFFFLLLLHWAISEPSVVGDF
jgi:hypothetical protein